MVDGISDQNWPLVCILLYQMHTHSYEVVVRYYSDVCYRVQKDLITGRH